MNPYFSDDNVQLYLGDMRDVLPAIGITADLVVADPPYGETSLTWDRWPASWPTLIAKHTSSLWCFGSMRMFLDRRDEFAGWHLSQDVVWEKHNGGGVAADRFRRVHEHVTHWYRGSWADLHHDVPRVAATRRRGGNVASRRQPSQFGALASSPYIDNGTRLARTVLQIRSPHGRAFHPTEKPVELLDLLIRYGCPPGGLVLDPFAGSASTLIAARDSGRHAIGVEVNEEYCERAARRLQQGCLFGGAA